MADKCIHQLFEEQVARTPDAVAVEVDGARLTYAELDRKANQIAHRLAQLGVGTEVRVALCIERSLEMLAAMLGVLKAGGAYVPLDPVYPLERQHFMLQDSKALVVLVQGELPLTLGPEVRVLRIEDLGPPTAEEARTPVSSVGPENLAYVIYTSGSTGQPKGVAIAHRSPVAYLRWAREQFAGAVQGSLGSTSISFDVSVFELFTTLISGGTVILVKNVLDLTRVSTPVTWINTVPSAMSQLLETTVLPTSLRTVDLAGEPVSKALVDRLYEANVERVVNLYGPTETGYTTAGVLAKGDEPVHIGRPLPGVKIYILDASGQQVPVGVSGELYAAGVGVARGYVNRPGLTAERFVPDPFGEPGGRMYRTGDVARWRADQTLELLGRNDDQIKIRGYRVELGEIEAALQAHPNVRSAVVTARDLATGTSLVGYVRLSTPTEFSELRRSLAVRLPEYMVPSAFVVLDEFPRTPNGKIDRKALPDPAPATDDNAGTAPRNEVEARLASIWQDVLGVERVGVEDDFFDIGGHSLLALRVVAQVQEAFGCELPLSDLFVAPTVAELAVRILEICAQEVDPDVLAQLVAETLESPTPTRPKV